MALINNQEETKLKIEEVFVQKMEEIFKLSDEIKDTDKNTIKENWQKMGKAIAEILVPICEHIVSQAEIGTIISDVVDVTATQSNTGTGLIS